MTASIDADIVRLEAAFTPHWAALSAQAEAEGRLVELDADARQQLGIGDSRVYLGWCASEFDQLINKPFVVVLNYGESGQDFQYSPDLVGLALSVRPAGCGGDLPSDGTRIGSATGWHRLSAGSFVQNTLGRATPPVVAMTAS